MNGQGFIPASVDAPVGAIPVSGEVRDVMVRSLAAMLCGATPEETLNMLSPQPGRKRAAKAMAARVRVMLGRPLEAQEMSAHVDVLLVALQSPAG